MREEAREARTASNGSTPPHRHFSFPLSSLPSTGEREEVFTRFSSDKTGVRKSYLEGSYGYVAIVARSSILLSSILLYSHCKGLHAFW